MEKAFRVSSAEGLVGREAELALAAAAVRELSEGRASVLAIEGEAGIGKTRLVQSIVDDARSRGVAVFSRPGTSLRAHTSVRCGRRGARSEPAVTGPAQGCDRRAAGRPGRRGAGAARRRRPVPGRRGDRGPGGDVVRRAPGAAGGRRHPLGGQRQPVGDLVGGAAAAACGVARRGDSPAVATAGRGRPAARRSGGRRRAHPATPAAEARRGGRARAPTCSEPLLVLP